MKILVSARMPEEVLTLLAQDHDLEVHKEDRPMEPRALIRSIEDKNGLLCTIYDRVNSDLLEHAPNLKMIASYSVGFDHIDVQASTRKGILVSNTPDVLTDATADLAFALIMATSRRVVEGDRRTRTGQFKSWAPQLFLGQEVTGKTLGIVGLGRIGKAVAKRAAGFDMKILYHNRTRLYPSAEKSLHVSYAPLDTLIKDSDIVTLHVPLSPQTRHLIGPRELELMKPSAYLINTARGAVVDEKALVQALRTDTIRGAGLDVYEDEPNLSPGLADLDNVVLLPHVGSATIETRTKMAVMAAENLLAGLRGERPPNCLNWPSIENK